MQHRNVKLCAGLFTVVVVLVFVSLPTPVRAQGVTDYFPIVRCGTAANPEPCTPCGLFEAGDRIVRFILVGLTGPVAAFMLVLAGGMFLVGADSPTMRTRAKGLLTRTILGVTVILLSWVATNFLLKLLSSNGAVDQKPWYEFSCPAFLQNIGQATLVPAPAASQGSPQQPSAGLVAAIKSSCTASALSEQFKTAPSTKNSADLVTLMNCLKEDPVVSALIRTDGGRPFTFDISHISCNYTHGIRTVCDSTCSHAQFSCHYGGATGTNGAEAADYSWNGKRVTYIESSRTIVSSCPSDTRCRTVGSRQDLFDEIYRAAKKNNCSYKLLNYEGDHVHISTPACDRDGTGVKGASTPSL